MRLGRELRPVSAWPLSQERPDGCRHVFRASLCSVAQLKCASPDGHWRWLVAVQYSSTCTVTLCQQGRPVVQDSLCPVLSHRGKPLGVWLRSSPMSTLQAPVSITTALSDVHQPSACGLSPASPLLKPEPCWCGAPSLPVLGVHFPWWLPSRHPSRSLEEKGRQEP